LIQQIFYALAVASIELNILTEFKIKHIIDEGIERQLNDLGGLNLRISKAGSKSWAFIYTHQTA
tara:strand:- start:307 stop:498 length:192 start_codon:yes stop_codon:yes gene_type:complete